MQMEDAPRGTVLITRTSGFLGQAIAEDLTAATRHRRVTVLVRRRHNGGNRSRSCDRYRWSAARHAQRRALWGWDRAVVWCEEAPSVGVY